VGGLESQAGRDARQPGRFPCFDGLRALAATMVLLVHASIITGAIDSNRAGEFLARTDSGVVLFFLISGFLLYRPYVIDHLGGRPALPVASFWRRRVLRIFPAYWVALFLIVYVLHQKTLHGPGDIVMFFGLLQIYDPHRVLGGLTQAWSLCTEIAFYLSLPLYAWVIGRGDRGSGQLRREWIGVAVLFAASLGFRFGIRAGDIDPFVRNSLPAWLDMFALGMALAVASVGLERMGRGRRAIDAIGRHPALCWMGAALTFVIVSTQFNLPRHAAVLKASQDFGEHYLYGLMSLLLILPAVFGPQGQGLVRRVLQNRAVVAVGVVSYGVYLWHIAIMVQLNQWFGGLHGVMPFVALAVLGLGATYLVALASYVLVEKPALKLKGDPTPAPARG